MLLRTAYLFDRTMRDREVDLARCGTGFFRSKPQAPEQRLGNSVVALILEQGRAPSRRHVRLPPVPDDQPALLEGREVPERGGRTDLQGGRRYFQRDAPIAGIPHRDGAERVELPARELLKSLHDSRHEWFLHKDRPNY
jgi:hypothetical protein